MLSFESGSQDTRSKIDGTPNVSCMFGGFWLWRGFGALAALAERVALRRALSDVAPCPFLGLGGFGTWEYNGASPRKFLS